MVFCWPTISLGSWGSFTNNRLAYLWPWTRKVQILGDWPLHDWVAYLFSQDIWHIRLMTASYYEFFFTSGCWGTHPLSSHVPSFSPLFHDELRSIPMNSVGPILPSNVPNQYHISSQNVVNSPKKYFFGIIIPYYPIFSMIVNSNYIYIQIFGVPRNFSVYHNFSKKNIRIVWG